MTDNSITQRIAMALEKASSAVRSILDPGRFLVDPDIKPFFHNQMADLTPANAVKDQGKYLIAEFAPGEGNVVIVKSMAFYAFQRNNVGDDSESVSMISPAAGNNFFQFDIQAGKSGNATLVKSILDAWTNAAGGTSQDEKPSGTFTLITDNPYADVMRNLDSATMGFPVSATGSCKVLFSLVQDAVTNPLSSRYVIGGTTATNPPLKRVDYAGAFIGGVQMSKAHYDKMMKSRAG